MQTHTPDPRSIALGLRLAPLARAYEEAAAVATTADDVEDAAFDAFLSDRTPANEAAWQAAAAITKPLNATKWSAFEAFRAEMEHGY